MILLWMLPACTEVIDRTQVMIVAGAESRVIARATELRVRARGGARLDALGEVSEQRFRGEALVWPLRVALVPEGDDATRVYEVTIEARDGSDVLTRAIVTGGYVEGETRVLPVTLGLCDTACAGDRSCEIASGDSTAECIAVRFRDPTDLARYDADDLPDVLVDGGMVMSEGGVQEGGIMEGGAEDVRSDVVDPPDVVVPPDEPFELDVRADETNPALVHVTGAVQSGWQVTIDWGDGQDVVVDEGPVDQSHVFVRAGTHRIVLAASSDDGETLSEDRDLVLRFVPPPDLDEGDIYLPLDMASAGCSNDQSGFGSDVFKDRFGDGAEACFVDAMNPEGVSAPEIPGVTMGDNLTITGWIRIPSGSLPNAVVIGRGSLPAIISETNAGLGFAVRANGSIIRSVRPAPTANTWHFYAGVLETRDGANTTLRFFLDAVSDSEAISGWTNEPDDCALRVGGGVSPDEAGGACAAYGASTFQTGSYDDVRVYNRALTAEEIRIIYDLEKP